MDCYMLGDVLFRWDGGGYCLEKGEFMNKFRFDGPWRGDSVTFRASLQPLTQFREFPLLLENDMFSAYDVNGERFLLYHWAYLRDGFGIWLDRLNGKREDVVSFDPAILSQKPMTEDWFFGVSGLHKALLQLDRPVLHASYVDIGGKAVLFTAPSGTGKSTQAQLWHTHAGAQIINGDRVLLGKRDGVWCAYGFPNCGSSRICLNRTLPIHAIVSLQQGAENRVEAMTVAEKLRCILAGTAVYRFDVGDIARASGLAGDILSSTQVLRLVCRPDAQAVETLKRELGV